VVAAVVDPDVLITLDDDLANNQKSRKAATAPRTLERVSYAAALMLTAVGP
jgi:hypothetical protein